MHCPAHKRVTKRWIWFRFVKRCGVLKYDPLVWWMIRSVLSLFDVINRYDLSWLLHCDLLICISKANQICIIRTVVLQLHNDSTCSQNAPGKSITISNSHVMQGKKLMTLSSSIWQGCTLQIRNKDMWSWLEIGCEYLKYTGEHSSYHIWPTHSWASRTTTQETWCNCHCCKSFLYTCLQNCFQGEQLVYMRTACYVRVSIFPHLCDLLTY